MSNNYFPYKVGDKIFVKPYELANPRICGLGQIIIEKETWEEDLENVPLEIVGMNSDVVKVEVKYKTVKSFGQTRLITSIARENIMGYAFKWGEKIQVRQVGAEAWKTARFLGYIPGAYSYTVAVMYDNYDFDAEYFLARPMPKEPEKIEITINGKPVTKKLSKESLIALGILEDE